MHQIKGFWVFDKHKAILLILNLNLFGLDVANNSIIVNGANDVIVVSLLLNLNIFYTLF